MILNHRILPHVFMQRVEHGRWLMENPAIVARAFRATEDTP